MAGTESSIDITKVRKQIDTCLAVVAKERDKLRTLQSELEDYLESMDKGVDALTDGVKFIQEGAEYIESGTEHLSEYI